MAGFRILDQFPQYTDAQNVPLAGGSLRFYLTNTTTPANVYGNKALSINNGSTVTLDSSGRTNVDVWGDGTALRVRLYAADGTLVDEADNVELPGGAATSLPAFVAGKFLTSDGSVLSWAAIRELPDPTGQSNKVLSTDGTAYIWIAKPVDGAAGAAGTGVITTATSLKSGSLLLQTGTGSAAASNSETASVAVTFPVAFTVVPVHIGLTVKNIAVASGVALVAHSVTAVTLTGFTANFNIADRHFVAGSTITNAIPFTYLAMGVA